MRSAFFLLALFTSSASFHAHALSSAELLAVQMPAWVERSGLRAPARAGMLLKQADILETGAKGRLQIGLAEGSLIKLGEQARIALAELPPATTREGVFKGVVKIVKGAFRFTTNALTHGRQRDITLRIASLTVGVRGSDLWGRASDSMDTVCLIDGAMRVKHAQGAELIIEQPLQFVAALRNAAPLPLAWVETDIFKLWAAETELEPDVGVTVAAGGWAVQLSAHTQREDAASFQQRLGQAGYATEVTQVKTQDRTYHRVRVSGFDTQADAKSFAGKIKGKFGVRSPWVAMKKADVDQ
jgi:hypothetical protein